MLAVSKKRKKGNDILYAKPKHNSDRHLAIIQVTVKKLHNIRLFEMQLDLIEHSLWEKQVMKRRHFTRYK